MLVSKVLRAFRRDSYDYDEQIGCASNHLEVLPLNNGSELLRLLKIQEEQFLLCGGEISWLTQGLQKVDPKLQRISELNEMMAYRPWIISPVHIEYLATGEQSD
jgi:hypothetical protein